MNKNPESILKERINNFEKFRKERLPVLHKFSEAIGLPNPHEILLVPKRYLPYLDEFLEDQVIEEHNRSWLITRIGYFFGEILVEEFQGCWMVDENTSSENFTKYVIGDFENNINTLTVDPFLFAARFVDTPAPRSLKNAYTDMLSNIPSFN
ncbi:hypothetical protein QCD60_26745 [Pokkaliibacter sp. MBI-7]|uniref:hypothetical protein n=1 Tax=Pokkaliibacter sp. MBI-7 TaxID=3040600 RepID=UPI002449AABA|nr:hypothetical protein [Pokkaliibacter sp. MBI-7]MDH2436134.1 hypothetical protein [Pokkaliibacter sp. MBI-7]